MTFWTEDDLIEILGGILLNDDEEIDGLDDDLVAYLSGLLSTELSEDPGQAEDILDESMLPFLESVGCPSNLMEKAKAAILAKAAQAEAAAPLEEGTRKLEQGIVSMSSTLTQQADEEADRYSWGPDDEKSKAAANKQIDAYSEKSSSKDRRKQKQELEKTRRDLALHYLMEESSTKAGVSSMLLPTVTSKEKDVQLQNITMALDNGTCLLEQGDLKFTYKRRYGLIGENGVGKTTLLSRIANWQDLEGFPQHLRVLHVRQELHTENEETIVLQAVLEADVERQSLLDLEKELLARLEGPDGGGAEDVTLTVAEKKKRWEVQKETNASFGDDLEKLNEVYEHLQLLGADSAQSRAAMILSGLQFSTEMQMAPISSLSGGWRMRVALAASLLIEPDLLLLDEPTNHLDLEAVIWLERYLVDYPHTVIVVSHDRGFLNLVCTDIIEFKKKKLTYYRGNFDAYVLSRDEHIRNDMRVYEAYASKRAHMMEFIEKFRANAKRATMVQSRVKTVEKMDVDAPEAVQADPKWRFTIPCAGPLGRPIISIDDVSFDYNPLREDGSKKDPSELLLQKVNFGVDLSSKIAILGANGQGKTTLLNLIMGKIRPVHGSVSINSGLRIAHFTQHHTESFDLKLSAVENMLGMFPGTEDQGMRSFLGQFQIQGNDALKPMGLLSGGQKSRVAFAALAYKKPHVLVIDEGSNHLSMDAVDALVEAVQNFKGGLMVVSHDQYFVSNTCTELWVVDSGVATKFRGTFDEYKAHTAAKTAKRVEESVKRIGNIHN